MFHIQRPTRNWTEALARLPDYSMIKATEDYQLFQEVKGISPTTFTVHRMVRDSWQHYTGTEDSGWFDPAVAQELARTWFNAFVDETFRASIAPFCDAVSWHNEIWANSQNETERQERIRATEAAVHVWNTEYRPTFTHQIKLIIGEAAVGNRMPRRIAELAIWSNNLLGYHPYDYWNYKQREEEGWIACTSLLHDAMEHDWKLKPTWVFTENGPIANAAAGWRAPECLGHDRDLYCEAVALWIRDVARTPAYQDGRIKGFSLFTTGRASNVWKHFWTEQPELNHLADTILQEWKPGTAAPPKPPPISPPTKHRAIAFKVPQEYSLEQWTAAAALAYHNRHTLTASHDDMLTILQAGNDTSYAKIVDPQYKSQQQAISLLTVLKLCWEPVYLKEK